MSGMIFDRESTRRIANDTRRGELSRHGRPPSGRPRSSVQIGIVPAISSTPINAHVGVTPGLGYAYLYEWDGFEFVPSDTEVHVRNIHPDQIPLETNLWITSWSGTYWVVGWECS